MQFNNSIERPFDGPAYLVGKISSNTSYFHEKMKEEDTMFHLIIAIFVTTLSKKQKNGIFLYVGTYEE